VEEIWAGGANFGTGRDKIRARARVFMLGLACIAATTGGRFSQNRFSSSLLKSDLLKSESKKI
jgi:hypothetical protein